MLYSDFVASPHGLLVNYGLLSFTKTAEQDSRAPLPQPQADLYYADTLRRRLPIETAYQTLASAVAWHQFGKTAEFADVSHETVQSRLDAAVRYFGLSGQVKAAIEHYEAANRDNPTDDQFGWVYTDSAGVTVRNYPLRHEAEIRKAASYLGSQREAFEYGVRREFARRILRNADQHGVTDLPYREALEKTAGLGIGLAAEIADNIELRAATLRHTRPDGAEDLRKIAAALREEPAKAHDAETLCKVATALDRVDAEIGQLRQYSDSYPMPEDVLFRFSEQTVKQAQSEFVTLTNGSSYARADLAKLPETLWQDAGMPVLSGPLFDSDAAIKTAAELPAVAADKLDFLLGAAGISPVDTHRSARPDLAALAAQYRRD